jgi:hypothetical protein
LPIAVPKAAMNMVMRSAAIDLAPQRIKIGQERHGGLCDVDAAGKCDRHAAANPTLSPDQSGKFFQAASIRGNRFAFGRTGTRHHSISESVGVDAD